MPWKVADVDRFKKGLSDGEKEQWVAVANSALSKCLADGGDRAKCEASAIQQASGVLKKRQEEQEAEPMPESELTEAVWTTAYVNNLPDSSFALVMPGGEKDDEGKTVPRSLRKLPYKDAEGNVDIPHLQNALARAPQMTGVSDAERSKAVRVLQAVAKKHLKSYQKEMEIVALALSLAESYAGLFLPGESTIVDGQSTPIDEPDEDQNMEAAETELTESASGHVLSLAEAQLPLDGTRAPVEFDMKIIAPGAGNKRDMHWYPADMLRRDAHVFEGVDVFVTDHNEKERSERTKVGRIKSIVGFTEDGGPIGRTVIYDPELAEKTRNRASAGELGTLHCSILANGTAKKGKIDGVPYHIVEAISSASAVDLVSRAGAGGRALSLAESERGGEPMDEEQTIEAQETQEAPARDPVEEPLEEVTLQEQQGDQEQEPVAEADPEPAQAPEPEEPPAPAMLPQERVQELVGASNLPDASKTRLSEAQYADEAGVGAAVKAEIAYLKEVMGSGKPFAQGAGDRPEHKPRTAKEADADWERILTEVGMQV